MAFKKKKTPKDSIASFTRDEKFVYKARLRVAKMRTSDLLDWADVAGSGMARAFGDYRSEGRGKSLDEVMEGCLALLALIEELKDRHIEPEE